MISQLTIFLENKKGRLSDACDVIADAGINLKALFLSDTRDYGVVRIFCDTPDRAAEVLQERGFLSRVIPVIAVRIPNESGGLSHLLKVCDEENFNIEYGYCFTVSGNVAIDVMRIEERGAEEKLAERGFDIVDPNDLYEVG